MASTPSVAGPAASTAAAYPHRLPSLTGLRFFAAFMVFMGHVQGLSVFDHQGIQETYNLVFANAGALGVSCFFLLSGFVLTWSARTSDSTRAYYRRRIIKVFPNHAVVWAVLVVMLLAVGQPPRLLQALANLFLVQAWIPEMSFTMEAVNGVTWSLSVEVAFYLLFPAFILLVRRIRPERLWFWTLGLVVLALLVPLLLTPYLPSQPAYPHIPGLSWPEIYAVYFGPPLRMVEFVVGMLLARIVLSGRWIRVPIPLALALVIGAYALARYLPIGIGLAVLYTLPLGLLVAGIASSDVRRRPTFLAKRPIVFLGELSYAFFLIHVTVLFELYEVFGTEVMTEMGPMVGLTGGPLGGVLFLLLVAAISVLLSWLLYSLVERPLMRRFGRRRGPAPKRREVPVADA